MKQRITIAFSATCALFSAFTCNKDDEAEEGKQAAIEFCNCYKTKSEEKCLEELKSNYSSVNYTTDEFIDAFNQQSTCGIKLERTFVNK